MRLKPCIIIIYDSISVKCPKYEYRKQMGDGLRLGEGESEEGIRHLGGEALPSLVLLGGEKYIFRSWSFVRGL